MINNCNRRDNQQIQQRRLDEIWPAPENDKLYRPVLSDDPEIVSLAKSILRNGLREPIVITEDNYILSGHRRHAACRLAMLKTVPVRVEAIRRDDDIEQFTYLLREYNRQRDKTHAEKLREELVSINPTIAYRKLIEKREELADVDVERIQLGKCRVRSTISQGKQDFRDAIRDIVDRYRKHWPLTDRRIHYYLLNDPPLKNSTGKHRARYANDKASYFNLTDMLTRMRLNGDIPFRAIADETRPMKVWKCFQDSRQFLREELNEFGQNYRRDLQQSQPNHIEVLAEKNTVLPTVAKVAARYCIPVTSGRGHASLDPRERMHRRYRRSGKEQLIVIVASDFDPAGECIAESFCRSMRDDFGVEAIVPIKAALTYEQTQTLDLPVDGLTPKKTDKQRKAFEDRYGKDQKCFELEAIEPEVLADILRESIDSVLDLDAFNKELEAEADDAAFVQTVREHFIDEILSDLEDDFEDDLEDD